jgi:hypothetical protein
MDMDTLSMSMDIVKQAYVHSTLILTVHEQEQKHDYGHKPENDHELKNCESAHFLKSREH